MWLKKRSLSILFNQVTSLKSIQCRNSGALTIYTGSMVTCDWQAWAISWKSSPSKNVYVACIGVQNRPPRSKPLWQVYYFELKTIKTLWTQKKLLPFYYLEELELGIFPRKRVTPTDKFYLGGPSYGKHLITQHLLFFLYPVNDPPVFEVPRPLSHSLAQDGIYTSFYLCVSEPLMYVGFLYIQININFLMLICLMSF